MSNPVIEIENLNLLIESTNLFSNFSLKVNTTERIGITGPSGCGKSTLIKSIIRNQFPINSNVVKFKKDLEANYSYVPQTNGLIPWYSLKRNLDIFLKDNFLYSETITKFQIRSSLNNFPHQLSGGEYQRAILACAIINKPDIYLADEPLTELDITKKWELLSFWSERIKHTKATLLLVSHDIDTLIYLCDRIIVLSDKPSIVIKEFLVSQPHPRRLDFLVSNEFLNSIKQLLEPTKNGQ